ncbi:hypothetical protein [Mycobacterium sp. NPDC050853]|uniref:hypothetical protein n=1 Tax=Mycobacterium sp. NPDC050853 TaxID=3155160 RepID=UPI0033F83BAD
MAFEANYWGTCQVCGKRFSIGDLIERHIDGYRHEDCHGDAEDVLGDRADACTRCFLIHAGECY